MIRVSSLLLVTLALLFSFCQPSHAAPISGSFTVDLVFAPNCVSQFNALEVTLPCTKVSDTIMKFEADLILHLRVSGLEIGSSTVFTFEGLEFQALHIATVIGALIIRDTFIFAPSVTEIEFVRTNEMLSLRYCINLAAPGDITPPFFDCPLPDETLFYLLEDIGFYHPAHQNLILATIYDGAGMLNVPLIFRKKIVELGFNIAGLTLSTRALFANLGSVAAPSYTAGVVLALEGQTVSGVIIRAETWIGTRQGLECFAECKPLEVYRVGKVLSPANFNIQEEKIFVRNLVLGSFTLAMRAEFQFFTQPGSSSPNPGLNFFQIEWRTLPIFPINLSFGNELRLGPDLNPHYDLLQLFWKFGDFSVTTSWIFYVSSMNMWEGQLAEFVATFDPPGLTVTQHLILCTEIYFVGYCSGGVFQHNTYVSAATGNITFSGKVKFIGFFGFSELWVDAGFNVGNVTFLFSTVLKLEYLAVVRVSTAIHF
jgi:hypothetical protein